MAFLCPCVLIAENLFFLNGVVVFMFRGLRNIKISLCLINIKLLLCA